MTKTLQEEYQSGQGKSYGVDGQQRSYALDSDRRVHDFHGTRGAPEVPVFQLRHHTVVLELSQTTTKFKYLIYYYILFFSNSW